MIHTPHPKHKPNPRSEARSKLTNTPDISAKDVRCAETAIGATSPGGRYSQHPAMGGLMVNGEMGNPGTVTTDMMLFGNGKADISAGTVINGDPVTEPDKAAYTALHVEGSTVVSTVNTNSTKKTTAAAQRAGSVFTSCMKHSP